MTPAISVVGLAPGCIETEVPLTNARDTCGSAPQPTSMSPLLVSLHVANCSMLMESELMLTLESVRGICKREITDGFPFSMSLKHTARLPLQTYVISYEMRRIS